MYGQVTIGNTTYTERIDILPFEFDVVNNGQISNGVRYVLPGIANFRMKGLTRSTVKNHAVVTNCPFKFRLGNSDGTTWYSQAGTMNTLGQNSPAGGSTDAVLDSLMFGTGQFPYPLTVPLFYSASGAVLMYVEDVSNNAPYTIYFGFHGSFLFVAQPNTSSAGS